MKWGNELNRDFFQRKMFRWQKHMKKCSTSLAIKKMQIKTMLSLHLTLIRMAIIENTTNVGEDLGKK
jgi:hypothetical protein